MSRVEIVNRKKLFLWFAGVFMVGFLVRGCCDDVEYVTKIRRINRYLSEGYNQFEIVGPCNLVLDKVQSRGGVMIGFGLVGDYVVIQCNDGSRVILPRESVYGVILSKK